MISSFPVSGKLSVESTSMIVDPDATCVKIFVLGFDSNFPYIEPLVLISLSYPKSILS